MRLTSRRWRPKTQILQVPVELYTGPTVHLCQFSKPEASAAEVCNEERRTPVESCSTREKRRSAFSALWTADLPVAAEASLPEADTALAFCPKSPVHPPFRCAWQCPVNACSNSLIWLEHSPSCVSRAGSWFDVNLAADRQFQEALRSSSMAISSWPEICPCSWLSLPMALVTLCFC